MRLFSCACRTWIISFQLIGLIVLTATLARAASPGEGFVLCDPDGRILASQHPDTPFIPASILKIFTSLAAIHALGENFRYRTAWLYDTNTRNLFIKGYGDPLFISEVLMDFSKAVAHHIRSREKESVINDIILDHTYFDAFITIPGAGRSLNPYDATSGALCANFNTIAFQWDTGSKSFVSAEPQTPLLPVYLPVVIKTSLKQGRITLNRSLNRLYPGYLAAYFLKKHHMTVTGSIREGTMPEPPVHFFQSPYRMTDLVKKLLEFSNNFMANQIMLTMGANRYGAPATLLKGVNTLETCGREQLKIAGMSIAEGSGISRENRITPMQMIRILQKFKPWHHLLRTTAVEFYKTGTLSGIRTRAGYIKGRDQKLYPFVIMVNRTGKGYDTIRQHLIDTVRQ